MKITILKMLLIQNIEKNQIYFYYFLKIFFLFIVSYSMKEKSINKLILKNNIQKNIIKLRDYPTNLNDPLILEEKKELIKYISKIVKKNITTIKYVFLGKNTTFDKLLIILSNAIFYCEILGCKKIFLDKNIYWFIKNNIIYKKCKMIIIISNNNNLKNNNILIDRTLNLLYYCKYIRPEIRLNVFKNEILKNLPYINIKPKELFIYIKSFDNYIEPHSSYIHAPFCFYEKILYNYNFTDVTIISENQNNLVINKILDKFKYVNFNDTIPITYKIAYLSKAYNLAISSSKFLYFLIKINDNLKYIWEFGKKNEIEKEIKDIISKKIILFKMVSSVEYEKIMKNSENCFSQLYLLLNYKCQYNFTFFNYFQKKE